MFCTNCGSQLADGLKFCTQCGTPVEVAETPAQEAPSQAAPAYEAPAYEAPAYEAPAQAAPAYEAPAQATPVYEAAPTYEAPIANDPGAGLGKTSKILGIFGIVTACCGFGSVLAIAALVLGIIGGNKSKSAGFENASAKTGLILGIVGIVLGIVVSFISLVVYFAGMSSYMYY